MEHLKQEHQQLTAEIRRLKKIAAAIQLSTKLRQNDHNELMIKAANCIDSLLREIERCQK